MRKFCTYCPKYICHRLLQIFPPHLNSASTLGYLVKLKSRVFVKILILEKRNSRNFTYWLWFYLLKKDAAFWLWHHVMANLKRKTRTKLCQNRPRFVKDMTKHFSVFFFGSQCISDSTLIRIDWSLITFAFMANWPGFPFDHCSISRCYCCCRLIVESELDIVVERRAERNFFTLEVMLGPL